MAHNKKGIVLFCMLVFMGLLSSLTASLFICIGTTLTRQEKSNLSAVSFWLAEAGIEKACYEMEKKGPLYPGEKTALGQGTFSITVAPLDSYTYLVVSTGDAGGKHAQKIIESRFVLKQNAAGYHVKKTGWREIR